MSDKFIKPNISEIGARATILVCDDDADARSIVVHALEAIGHKIIQASDGQGAIDTCNNAMPDLIVMDIMMPGVTGIDFVKWLREEKPDVFIPLLFVTALGEVDNKIEGLAVGADDYLTKPFNYRELQAKVQALLRIRDLHEKLQRQTAELMRANDELSRMQNELIEKERALVAVQMAGAAAHNLGQPLTTILLNCNIVEKCLSSNDVSLANEKILNALKTIKSECNGMSDVVTRLKAVNPNQTANYVGDLKILDISPTSSRKPD